MAGRYRFRDGDGELGVIASVSRPFCGDCTRARLSAEGHLYTCLFAVVGDGPQGAAARRRDGRRADGADRGGLGARVDRYSELRSAATERLPKVEMFALGGWRTGRPATPLRPQARPQRGKSVDAAGPSDAGSWKTGLDRGPGP